MQNRGVSVERVELGGVADALGLSVGDEILAINGVDVSDCDSAAC